MLRLRGGDIKIMEKERGRIMSKKLISLADCCVAFDGELVLDHINLYFNDSEFLTLLGPSGCGKTTTLRIIGGFITPTSGEVLFDDVRMNDIPPNLRKVNTVFQRYALFPHLNVFENVAFGLRIPKTVEEGGRKRKVRVPEAEIRQRVLEMLEVVSLKGFDQRRISELSGGQQQRVAIARALVNRPKVLLLDEPLGALDLRLRKDMQSELKRIQQQLGITFIYVTHDQEEALTLSDHIAVFNKGVIEQIGTPNEVYNHSATEFVCNFIGDINLLQAEAVSALNRAGGRVDPAAHNYIRLERIHVNVDPKPGSVALEGVVDSAASQRTLSGTKSVAQLFYERDILLDTKVNKDVFSGIARVKSYLKSGRLFIFSTCRNLIREIKSYWWGKDDMPVKKDDHALDALRYYIMSRPITPIMGKAEDSEIVKDKKKLIRRNNNRSK